jgi:PLP dependent protein
MDAPFPNTVAGRIAAVQARIARAEATAGRSTGSVTLTAVSKTQPISALRHALAAGQRVFGENRVQEAESHWHKSGLREVPGLELRLIGPLQTNKAEEACALFDVIETLDREKLALALLKAADRTGRLPSLLVQVNTGAEPQKAGVLPADLPGFIEQLRTGLSLEPAGLMCIPPAGEAPAPHFAWLARAARTLGLPVLSMGMSSDLEAGVHQGATHVRVGTALFGERQAPDAAEPGPA